MMFQLEREVSNMNYKQFINQVTINSNNERGVVSSFDDEHIVIRYENNEKTYNQETAFSKKFLRFENNILNQIIKNDINKRNIQEMKNQQIINRNEKAARKRNRRILEEYEFISSKNKTLQRLFGKDFLYPPYLEFVKKNRLLINS